MRYFYVWNRSRWSRPRRPDALCLVKDRGDDRDPRGHKYLLLFDKSSRYDLKVVVSILAGKAKVITAHVQNKKRRRAYANEA